MRTQVIALVAAISMSALTIAASQTASPSKTTTSPADLAGTWISEPYELPLSTDFDKSVWGPNAKSVRDVRLVIGKDGSGTLTVTRKVLDAKGRTVAGSVSIEEAKVTVGGLLESTSPRPEHEVNVISAERRYPDDKGDAWKIEGLRVKLAVLEGAARGIEIRFDTPEGRGSFWEKLSRQGRKPPPRK
jgi:hypothetical protein